MNKYKGSEWRKWDLHFHSPSSYDYANGSITNQNIIDELANKGISVIAITDHHVIDTARIKELQVLGKDKGITVLPGIEFLSDARGDEPIHFIGIFSESSDIDYIWAQIENGTSIKKIKGEGKKHNEVYCDLADTVALIKELGGIVSIHAGKKTNGIENITHSLPHGAAQKEDIAKLIDIFEMGKETDCADYLQKVIPFLKKKIGKHIPLIICSDNHNIADYKVKQNLWIKADPNFEGLKQIIYEPDHRVKIQAEKPDFKEDKLIIEEIKFISSDNRFTSQTIYLNENLNVIIGGKSSGKSILLYHIANTLHADKEFFKREKIDDKYKFNIDDTAFNFEIKTKGEFSQLLNRTPDENSIIPEIKYIPQNYLVKLAEPETNKKGEALTKIVRDLINEDPSSKEHYDEFLSKIKANDKKREGIIDNYFEIRDRITNLEGQLKIKSQKEVLEKNIATNTSKVEELNKSAGMTEEQIEKYTLLQKQLEEVKIGRSKAQSDYKKIVEFNTETKNSLTSIKNKERIISNSLENPVLKELFTQTYSGLDNLLSTVDDTNSKFEIVSNDGVSTFKKESEVSKIFSDFRTKQKEIEDQLQPYVQNEVLKKQIEEISKSISDDKTALQDIEHLKKEISECQRTLLEEKTKLFKLYEDTYQEYENVIAQLKKRTVDLETKDGLKITGITKFNFPKFGRAVRGFSDGRTASYNKFSICDDKKDYLAEFKLQDLINELQQMFEAIVETGEYTLTKNNSDKKAVIKILLNDEFFDYWEIEYKNDKLGEMSTGKASFVILMLIVGLSRSKAPILIDQPEDNLDNRSITTDLVEYLRNKKVERQIILVTHNPNVVVNADAENIIIANQKGQNEIDTSSPFTFDYINGSLENSFPKNEAQKDLLKSMGIREHIAEIVEGGKEAFKKREEKYGFK